MRWWRNLKSSVAPDRGTSGDTRGSVKTKKTGPVQSGVSGPQAAKFNLASNSMYLGLRSIGGM